MVKKCIICNEKLNKLLKYDKFNLDIGHCDKCNLYQILGEDKFIKNKYESYYKNEFWHSSRSKGNFLFELKRKIINFLVHFARKLNISPLMTISQYNLFKKFLKGKKFLEIGAGHGHTLRFFKNKKMIIRAIEPDYKKTKEINKYFHKNICSSLDVELDKVEGQYDLIYMSHVFEHFVNPLKLLEKIKKNFTKEGIIFIEVPNCENKEMLEFSLKGQLHTFHFSLESLNKLFEKANYKILLSGVYDDSYKSILGRIFKNIFMLNNYSIHSKKNGKKLILIGKPI